MLGGNGVITQGTFNLAPNISIVIGSGADILFASQVRIYGGKTSFSKTPRLTVVFVCSCDFVQVKS